MQREPTYSSNKEDKILSNTYAKNAQKLQEGNIKTVLKDTKVDLDKCSRLSVLGKDEPM